MPCSTLITSFKRRFSPSSQVTYRACSRATAVKPAIDARTPVWSLVNNSKPHERDLAIGAGYVELPEALALKYPKAGREWGRQWIFPATRIYKDQVTG